MSKLYFFLVMLLLNSSFLFSQVAINADGSAPHTSAMLDVKSTNKGFLPPRMTQAEMFAISSAANGLVVYCTDCGTERTGALSISIMGTWYWFTTNCLPPVAPTTGTHVPSVTQIVWNWNAAATATGYKWNTTNNYATATDLGNATTITQTGLTCNTAYSIYVWAYSSCGYSVATTLTQNTSQNPPAQSTAGTHTSTVTSIVWNWGTVAGATGYKWNTVENYATATEMNTVTTKSETGLTCNTTYARYVWAYNSCGVSASRLLSKTTDMIATTAPAALTNTASQNEIVWNWGSVSGVSGYKWGTTNNYLNATDMGSNTTFTETGLYCNNNYTRYVWSYGSCGNSTAVPLTQSTITNPPSTPTAGVATATSTTVNWVWHKVQGSNLETVGYKISSTNNFATAIDLGYDTTFIEPLLSCNTLYTRYVWAYTACGYSAMVTLQKSTSSVTPVAPIAATNYGYLNSIAWNWSVVPNVTGYKWNTTNNYATAIDIQPNTNNTYTQTGLICNVSYTCYVWSYTLCGNSTPLLLTCSTAQSPPPTPTAGTQTPSTTQIVWNWNASTEATGYKWNTTNNYTTATDIGNVITKTETGLTCNTSFTHFVWAYGACGYQATPLTLIQSTTTNPPVAPTAATQTPTATQITWGWNIVSGAVGYKWGTTNVYANATDLGSATTKTETGLTCSTSYTRYIWAYSSCGSSAIPLSITQSTNTNPPPTPVAGTHPATTSQITWKWNKVSDATGYKWGITNDYASATDMTTDTAKVETPLNCMQAYTRYAWAYNSCGNSSPVTLTQSTTAAAFATPAPDACYGNVTTMGWHWFAVTNATGYKISATNDISLATDVGIYTQYLEGNLTCNTSYTRYVWAITYCGFSTTPLVLSASTSAVAPASPTAGTHVATASQVTWNWNSVSGATGYKWNSTNDYASATDMGSATTNTQTGLTCNNSYNSYVWAYSACGTSVVLTLNASTTATSISTPTAGTQTFGSNNITWAWNTVIGATGYKWNTSDNFATATDMGTATTKAESGLTCNNSYIRYVWAYCACGTSSSLSITQATTACFSCGSSLSINHVASGGVAPVNKSVTYGTVTNIPGETTKCWITSNLGADHQATAVEDATEPSAGWYWQFNRVQGYKHDGTTLTPSASWLTDIGESSEWLLANDPCNKELGGTWRLPTATEWTNVDASGWTNWNGPWNSALKLHGAGLVVQSTSLAYRGSRGYYQSSNQVSYTISYNLQFTNSTSIVNSGIYKYQGQSVRCIKD